MIEIPATDQNAQLSVLSSISRFARIPETEAMRVWLKAELARLDQANRREIGEAEYRQRQGACQALEDIFKLVDTAHVTAEKIRVNISKRKGESL